RSSVRIRRWWRTPRSTMPLFPKGTGLRIAPWESSAFVSRGRTTCFITVGCSCRAPRRPASPPLYLTGHTSQDPIGRLLRATPGGRGCPRLIYRQPRNQDVLEGDRTSFSVVAQGTNVTYQWLRDGVPLINGASVSGADTRALTIDPVGRFDGGSISVLVG